ncbi:ATP-binding protein [Chitinispirillales bacterium ANBcel5]|uniref:ATP-binding protein n=1 Tax=Cellulosispirillum alkaliphilum TaxID=3039283 RepID=UPI002A51A8D1|nr:ATP-binding protein [Chitinispirillales bacterium ANBcel5]
MEQPKFRVDSRLAILLSENYRSSELAIKELVDNAWDADAEKVSIELPEPVTSKPIVVEDNGNGMTPQEMQSEYLVVAKDRRSSKGKLTVGKKRKVKGRKGIGKFAGLISASTMKLETWARGTLTQIVIHKDQLLDASRDLEQLDLLPEIQSVEEQKSGTKITLTHLNQSLKFPLADKLREILIREYGREYDFEIFINGNRLSIEDISGETRTVEKQFGEIGHASLIFTVSDGKRPFKNSGIALRVDGKIIGKPTFFGLEESEDFPKSILGKIYGEVEADGLVDDITADWGTIIENSVAYEELKKWVVPEIRDAAKRIYGQEIHLSQARLQKKVNERMQHLPEFKRYFAQKALNKLLQKYYNEPEDRLEPIVNVVLDAIECDEYFFILDTIDKAKQGDVASFADALEKSSLTEMAIIQHQIAFRRRMIDEIEEIVKNPNSLEKHIHQTFENRLWILGIEYSLKSSNITLKRIIEEYLQSNKYTGPGASKRPDLLLINDVLGQHSVIEFKRPSHTLKHEDYRQAIEYRHELMSDLQNMEVIIIGGKRDEGLKTSYTENNVKFMTFNEIIAVARRQFDWFIDEVSKKIQLDK